MKVALLCLVLGIAVAAERKLYEGYKVYRVTPSTKRQADLLHKLEEDVRLDFWQEATAIGHDVEVMVPPEMLKDMEAFFMRHGLQYDVIRDHLDKDIKELFERLDAKTSFDLDDYNRYEFIMDEVEAMAEQCPDSISCETYDIGNSVEGNRIMVLKISAGPGKKAIWVDALIHAREWLAGATMLKIFDRMTRDYDTDEEVQTLLDSYDWYYVPVHNPDGYIHSWDVDRMWRKSRNINTGSSCLGVDLNRNFNYNWNVGGSSGNPCSNTYMGRAAASELETQVVIAEASRHEDDLMAFVTVHTAANMLLVPFGFFTDGRCTRADQWEDLMQVVGATCDAIMETHNTVWRCGNACETLYETSGTSRDWARGAINVKYVYTAELRGPGFDPPASHIPLSYQEFWNGFVAMVEEMNIVDGNVISK